jgi:hypothetical protein
MWDLPNFYTSIFINCDEWKMQLISIRFNAFKMNGFNSFTNVNNIIDVKNSFNHSSIIAKQVTIQYVKANARCSMWVLVLTY